MNNGTFSAPALAVGILLSAATACSNDPPAVITADTAPSSDATAAPTTPARPDRGAEGPEDPTSPRWNKFHTSTEVNASLEALAVKFPTLTEVYSIGETRGGNPLLVIEITNESTGPAAEKPGYYYDGNIHAGELTGGEVALHFAWYLLTNYGRDDRVTSIVDSRALYIRPKFNPDGADLALTTAQTLRSTPRPYDQDGDGLLDEDPPNDLDRDGHITQMRIPDADGDWYVSPDDARLMVRVPGSGGGRGGGRGGGGAAAPPPAGAPRYRLMSEGIDDDGDGRHNEDGVGGIDMNRNFPRNWGMEFEQTGAGPYPLSEPETAATIAFLDSHRNITGIFHGHTSGGFAFRLPSTTAWSEFPAADQELILEQSAMYEQTTEQPARPSYTNPNVHRHGTLISWGYWDFGVVGFVPEFWGGFGLDDDEDGTVSQLERLRFHDEELENDYFTEWASYDHPEYGAVEIGGWHSKFTTQNPPRELLQRELELYVPWMLWLAEIAPQIAVGEPSVTRESDDTFRVRLQVTNEGHLPTNITQRALDTGVAVPVRALVEPRRAELVEGSARADLGHLSGRRSGGDGGSAEAEWVVRATGNNPELAITVVSEKGGTVRRRVTLR